MPSDANAVMQMQYELSRLDLLVLSFLDEPRPEKEDQGERYGEQLRARNIL